TPAVSNAAIVPLEFTRSVDSRWIATVDLPIDRAGAVDLALLSPDAGSWRLEVPAGARASDRRIALAGDEMPGWVVARYDVKDARPGRWTVRVEAPSSPRAPSSGFLLAHTQ